MWGKTLRELKDIWEKTVEGENGTHKQ